MSYTCFFTRVPHEFSVARGDVPRSKRRRVDGDGEVILFSAVSLIAYLHLYRIPSLKLNTTTSKITSLPLVSSSKCKIDNGISRGN